MQEIIVTGKRAMAHSYAKINLTLDITGVREDGYHTLETIMQTVNLFDLIIVDKQSHGIKITTNKKFLPTNEKNIAYKAADAFFKAWGREKGAKILIHKNIPVSAGLAGGSGNAGATLLSLNRLYNQPFSFEELLKIGAALGADVPYCMSGGTQLGCGVGDILTPIEHKSKYCILMVTPPIAVSTPWVYSEFDNIPKPASPDTAAMIDALKNEDYYKMCANLSNVLEGVTAEKHPVIRGIKEKMILNGANGALMSGSGPTVFGFFDDYKKAKVSHDSFSHIYKDVYLTTTL